MAKVSHFRDVVNGGAGGTLDEPPRFPWERQERVESQRRLLASRQGRQCRALLKLLRELDDLTGEVENGLTPGSPLYDYLDAVNEDGIKTIPPGDLMRVLTFASEAAHYARCVLQGCGPFGN